MKAITIDVELDGTALSTATDRIILAALHQTNGGTTQAAKLLGCSVRKVQYRLKQMGRRSSEFRIDEKYLKAAE